MDRPYLEIRKRRIFLKIQYLFINEKHRERERERQRHRAEGEAGSCRELDVGLDPGFPGSRPGLEVALNPLSQQGCPGA